MMNDIIPFSTLTMTSREIAELVGKRHDHVLRDVDRLLGTLNPDLGLGFKSSTYVDSTGKENRQYELDRDASICLVSGYDANSRMRIIKRWQELEAVQSKPRTLAEQCLYQAQLLVDQERRIAQLALEAVQTKLLADQAHERMDRIETGIDHFTIIGYARAFTNESLPLAEAAKRGTLAAAYCKKHDIAMGDVPDPRFGRVKTYPKWVIDEVLKTAVN